MKLSQFAGPVRAQSFWLTVFCIENIVVYLRLLFHSLPSRQEILRNDALGCHQSVCVQFNGCPPVTLAFADSELLSLLEGQFLVRASLEGPQRSVYLTFGLRRGWTWRNLFGGVCRFFNFSLRWREKSLTKRPQTGARTAPVLVHFIWKWIYDYNRFRNDETWKLSPPPSSV